MPRHNGPTMGCSPVVSTRAKLVPHLQTNLHVQRKQPVRKRGLLGLSGAAWFEIDESVAKSCRRRNSRARLGVRGNMRMSANVRFEPHPFCPMTEEQLTPPLIREPGSNDRRMLQDAE